MCSSISVSECGGLERSMFLDLARLSDPITMIVSGAPAWAGLTSCWTLASRAELGNRRLAIVETCSRAAVAVAPAVSTTTTAVAARKRFHMLHARRGGSVGIAGKASDRPSGPGRVRARVPGYPRRDDRPTQPRAAR